MKTLKKLWQRYFYTLANALNTACTIYNNVESFERSCISFAKGGASQLISILFQSSLNYTLLIIRNMKEMDLISSLILSPENDLQIESCGATVSNIFLAFVLPDSLDYSTLSCLIAITQFI